MSSMMKKSPCWRKDLSQVLTQIQAILLMKTKMPKSREVEMHTICFMLSRTTCHSNLSSSSRAQLSEASNLWADYSDDDDYEEEQKILAEWERENSDDDEDDVHDDDRGEEVAIDSSDSFSIVSEESEQYQQYAKQKNKSRRHIIRNHTESRRRVSVESMISIWTIQRFTLQRMSHYFNIYLNESAV
jgi:hypothetical protein